MQSTAANLGKYEIELGGGDLASRVTSLSFQQSLDQIAELRLSLAMRPETLEKWSLADYPAEAALTWQGKAIFRGHLWRAETSGHSRARLVYVDGFHGAAKRSVSQFAKQQTLQDLLTKIATACGLQASFRGSFSEPLPGFPQGGMPLLSLVQGLGEKHGFYFVTRSGSGEVVFLKPGQSVASASLDVTRDAASLSFGQSAGLSVERAQFRYFDSKSVEAKHTSVSSDELYQPLQAFTGESAFQDKLKWKTAGGSVETHFTDRFHFDRGQQLLAGQYSKRAMQQESMSVTCFSPLALPGDKLKVAKAPAPAVHDGTYLVASADIEITSALPRMSLSIIRP